MVALFHETVHFLFKYTVAGALRMPTQSFCGPRIVLVSDAQLCAALQAAALRRDAARSEARVRTTWFTTSARDYAANARAVVAAVDVARCGASGSATVDDAAVALAVAESARRPCIVVGIVAAAVVNGASAAPANASVVRLCAERRVPFMVVARGSDDNADTLLDAVLDLVWER